MKIAVFDSSKTITQCLNNRFNNFVFEKFDFRNFDFEKGEQLGKYDATLINIEDEQQGKRTNFEGVENIFKLRLKAHFIKSIICYGFCPSSLILKRKPQYVVLHAPGNFYCQIPDGFKHLERYINDKSLEGYNDKEIRNDYIHFVNKAINLDGQRHIKANWWGLKTLWDCHMTITKGDFERTYPNEIKSEAASIDCFLLEYKYELDGSRLNDLIKVERSNLISKFDKLNKDINEINIKLNENETKVECEDFIQLFQKEIEDINENYLPYLPTKEREEFQAKIFSYIEEIEKLYGQIEKRDKLKEKKEQLKSNQTLLRDTNIFDNVRNQLKIKFKNGFRHNPKVLLIDDQHKDGWADIYQYIIYGKTEEEQFIVPDFSFNNGVEQIIDVLKKEKLNEFDFILLDLRLFPDNDPKEYHKLKCVSGIKVLDYIKKNCSTPVLITSASNKIWSYKEIISMGADAYWTKEGADNLMDANSSLNNYKELVRILNVFMNEEYKFGKEVRRKFYEFEVKGKHWWEKVDWHKNADSTKLNFKPSTQCDFSNLQSIYKDTLLLYYSFLRNKFIKQTETGQDWFYYSSIILHFGKALEMIHNQPDECDPEKCDNLIKCIRKNDKCKEIKKCKRRFINTWSLLTERNDKIGKEITIDRNKAAHIKESKDIDFVIFQKFINEMNRYLSNSPK